jgi:hypothetical protein
MSWWAWINIVAAVAGFLYWLRGANQGFCLHRWEAGRNRFLTGALTCSKCGRVQYPENMKLRKLYRAIGRIHKESDQ